MRAALAVYFVVFATLASAQAPGDVPSVDSSAISRGLFDMFLLSTGLIGMPLILLTIWLSRTVQRDGVFINFCITWIVYSISFALLCFAGQQDQFFPESLQLCNVQATLTYGSIALTQVSGLALVIQFAIRLHETSHGIKWWRPYASSLLIVLPWLAFLGYCTKIIVGIIQTSQLPPGVHATGMVFNPGFFCRQMDAASVVPIAMMVVATKGPSLVIEAGIAWWLYRRWNLVNNATGVGGLFPASTLFRLLMFTLYSILIVVVAVAITQNPTVLSYGDFFLATVPFASFTIFGTSKDIMLAWVNAIRRAFGRAPLDNFTTVSSRERTQNASQGTNMNFASVASTATRDTMVTVGPFTKPNHDEEMALSRDPSTVYVSEWLSRKNTNSPESV